MSTFHSSMRFAREFVERHAILFDGRNHWRHLHLVTDEFGGFFIQIFQRQWRHGQGSGDFAIGIVGVRGFTEL